MISVLLVDPASENPHVIRKLLASAGNNFKLNCATSYRGILDGFRSNAYDVCLIDADMETSLKLVTQARSLGWTAPIVMTASNVAGEAIRAIRSGVADCLIRGQLSGAGLEHSLCWVVEQARNMALLKERERRYLALLDNANQVVYTHDLNGALLSVNRAGERLLGYPLAQLLGMNICQLVAPEHQELMKSLIAHTLDAQTQISAEVKMITEDGRALLVKINTHPINHDGQSIEVQGIAIRQAVRRQDRPREFRGLAAKGQSPAALDRNQSHIRRTYEAANSFPLHENSTDSSRSSLTA